jgi:hypothetical protein
MDGAMTEQLSRSFEDQLIRGLLGLLLLVIGIMQLFFVNEIKRRLLSLRQYLAQVYDRHPILLRMFGPPLKTIDLKGYTVAKRIGGVIFIILSIALLISIFQAPDPCDDYWSMTRSGRC